ncbi:MAG TPA: thioredoxin family protein [Chitinophagaceae bacterium]|nr:thioredoxin family protein [Chitinophagaceae bacterium]
MKLFLVLVSAVFLSTTTLSQDLSKFNLYKPDEDAERKLSEAINRAEQERKHVFVQIGGNWCIWCARFNDLATTNKSVDSVLNKNYIVYHLNYSKENKNEKLLARFSYPQRFGFPVFLILNGKGELIHTQNSAYLEEGKGYDVKTVVSFLSDWSPEAIDPKNYVDP